MNKSLSTNSFNFIPGKWTRRMRVKILLVLLLLPWVAVNPFITLKNVYELL